MSRHPAAALLQHHAYSGTVPAADEVAELNLDATAAAAVTSAAREASELHSAGECGKAHEHARVAAAAIVAELPAAQQDPRYLQRDPHEAVTNPAELAALVDRF